MAFNGLLQSLNRTNIVLNRKIITYQQCLSYSLRVAYYSTDNDPLKKKKPPDFNSYILEKYSNYIKNFENLLSKRFPKAMTVYRGFMDGVSLFYMDVKQYVKILAKVNAPGKGIHELTRQELEIYVKVPKEMIKLAPVLIGSALPMGYTFLMPLAYYFPKTLMTEHFWTPAQRIKFMKETMINRLKQSRAIVKVLTTPNICMQNQVADEKLWIVVQNELKTNQLIYPHKLIGCIHMFRGSPFQLNKLSRFHIIHLAKLHDLNTFWFPKKALKQRAQLILAMDRAIIKEGGIKKLSPEDMRYVCKLRGLYAEELDVETMKEWLNKWIQISVSVEDSSLSLILHASAILGFNAPSNKKLIRASGDALNKLRLNGRAALKRMTN